MSGAHVLEQPISLSELTGRSVDRLRAIGHSAVIKFNSVLLGAESYLTARSLERDQYTRQTGFAALEEIRGSNPDLVSSVEARFS